MKVKYLSVEPLPGSGEILEIADIPDGVEWYLTGREGSTYIDLNHIYRKEGTILHYCNVGPDGKRRGHGTNKRWIDTDNALNYRGQIV